MWGCDPDKPIDEYLLLEREWFNNDYEEFMSGNDLNTVSCIQDNIVFIDDLLIFSCTEIEVVKAISIKDVAVELKRFLENFNKKYNRKK